MITKQKRKIVLIGDGLVGSAYAFSVVQQGLANELVIINKKPDRSMGDALDLEDATPFTAPVSVSAGGYKDCQDADIVVICAGAAQKPGETRLQLVEKNLKIMKEIVQEVVNTGFKGIFLVAANPVDILTYAVQKISDFPANKVIGSGTSLDSARLRVALGKEFKVDPRDVRVDMLAEHGDSEFAAYSCATIGGIPLLDYAATMGISIQRLQRIEDQIRNKAYDIINRKGATYYGVATSLARITKAIMDDQNAALPVSVYLNGEYGQKDIYLGTPAVINRQGIRKVIELPLNAREQVSLANSAKVLQETTANGMAKAGLVNYLWK
ncbi:L-lactate dehydrogenase [Lactobacillus sp. 0.1XD8-4]|uniref:L-lactate dehydrogenase n=1 Tax=uncultured Limosilactobacillus sp. TaxID=2837629 RepID=UPI00129D7673|nr:L-lactate dehydrogenase [uncultured Limosilactobacillus sp.]MRN06398.1 L-lactate dehydrogenase [Lactobacillus sp. 0.1XD8-4]